MTRLIVSGAAGRMGSRILALASQDFDFKIVGALEANGSSAIGKEVLPGLRISDDLDSLLSIGDVLVEFTNPEATLLHLEQVLKAGKAIVVGTTGFTTELQMEKIHKSSDVIPILLSPNMSVGVNQFYEIIKQTSRQLGNGYKIEITETHHQHKKDAPSGTAKELAEVIAETLKMRVDQIPIHSIREGEIVGIHTVTFIGKEEKIELTHSADSRDIFALGALRAAKFIVTKKPGFYTMENVINP